MRILLGYSHYQDDVDVGIRTKAWLARLRAGGIQVDGFCLTLNPPGPRLGWHELDAMWRRGEKGLLGLYETLALRLGEYDMFINYSGINLHPEFVQQLSTFNVFSCFDDPESSNDLSRPAAWAYDLCMVGNIAELETYRSWGVKEVRFWPLGFRMDDYDASLTGVGILQQQRDIEIALLCERMSPWRQERLDRVSAAFPDGAYYGHGWPNGFLAEKERVPLLQRTRIGINIHNSTGPVNFRTYVLPANGVMQICDNKSYLANLFELGNEVVGFDSIAEAIELCHYYLQHDDERKLIAAAGWARATRDYSELAVFRLVLKYSADVRPVEREPSTDIVVFLQSHRTKTLMGRSFHGLRRVLRHMVQLVHRQLANFGQHFHPV